MVEKTMERVRLIMVAVTMMNVMVPTGEFALHQDSTVCSSAVQSKPQVVLG